MSNLTKSLPLLMILFNSKRSKTVKHLVNKLVVFSSSSNSANIDAEQSMIKIVASRPVSLAGA